jgi:HD superfamily phosphodiesterase
MNSTFIYDAFGIKLEVEYDNYFDCQGVFLPESKIDIYDILDEYHTKRIEDKLLELSDETQIESGKSWNGIEWE